MDKAELTVKYLTAGYSCSEAVLLGFAPELGLNRDQAVGLARGFAGGAGGGMACGVFAAGCMVLGLSFRGGEAKDARSRERVLRLVREFEASYERSVGPATCAAYLKSKGVDRYNSKEMQGLRESGICADPVGRGAALLARLLAGEGRE